MERQKGGQRGQNDRPREITGNVDPHHSTDRAACSPIGVFEIGEDLHAAPLIGLALNRSRHVTGRALEQTNAEALLQGLHRGGRDGARYAQICGGGGLLQWEFERDGRAFKVRPGGPLIVNEEALAGAAVRAGAGLGYMMEHDIADEVADGRLVQVLDDWCPHYPGCHLYYPSRQVTPALRALIDALRWSGPLSPAPSREGV